MGELGFKPWDVLRMTMREMDLAIYGLREKDNSIRGWLKATGVIAACTGFNTKSLDKVANRALPTYNPNEKGHEINIDKIKDISRRFDESPLAKKLKKKMDARGSKTNSRRGHTGSGKGSRQS